MVYAYSLAMIIREFPTLCHIFVQFIEVSRAVQRRVWASVADEYFLLYFGANNQAL